MTAKVELPPDVLEQIRVRAASVAATAASAATRTCGDVEGTVRLHVENALMEALYNTLRLDVAYLRGLREPGLAEALSGGDSLRRQTVLAAKSGE